MDPDRVQAYLQAACSGLGFDIGEVWRTSNRRQPNGTFPTKAVRNICRKLVRNLVHHLRDFDVRHQVLLSPANQKRLLTPSFLFFCVGWGESDSSDDEEHQHLKGRQLVLPKPKSRRYRFVQLYTSKSYESRRSELVNPPEGASAEGDDEDEPDASSSPSGRRGSSDNLSKHVLSPRLVEAIASSSQVVWANSRKQEGLIGRSEMRLQTAVGMPVAVDSSGNMMIVVMFSPSNIISSDDAMDFLQSLNQSATSASIPCLLPVFDPRSSDMRALPASQPTSHSGSLVRRNSLRRDHVASLSSLGEGVTARFVSFEHTQSTDDFMETELPHADHSVSTAPKDTFGIPMLPDCAELDPVDNNSSSMTIDNDAALNGDLDIFDEASYGIWSTIMDSLAEDFSPTPAKAQPFNGENVSPNVTPAAYVSADVSELAPVETSMVVLNPVHLSDHRRERLEEFCGAFLGMSVFDVADVWIPAGGNMSSFLRHATTVCSKDTISESVLLFQEESQVTLVRFWSGAVGRAFSSGNPVWSTNPNVFVDSGRTAAFQRAGIQTVLAVPIFSRNEKLPTCVVACYSLVRASSAPFVLKFVQQALRLMWDGLEDVELHESVAADVWRDVGPADLGEMAADLEMQQHFFSRKRSRTYSIMEDPSLIPSVSEQSRDDVSTGQLMQQLETMNLPNGGRNNERTVVNTGYIPPPPSPTPEEMMLMANIDVGMLQDYLADALKSVNESQSFSNQHVPTNPQGTKRAHISSPLTGVMGTPLAAPKPLPTRIVSSTPPSTPVADTPKGTASPLPPLPFTHVSGAQMGHLSPVVARHPTQLGDTYSGPQQPSQSPVQRKIESATPQQAQILQPIIASDGSAVPITFKNGMLFLGSQQICLPVQVHPDSAVRSSTPEDWQDDGTPKQCRIQGCPDMSVARRPYCVQHSGNRLCEHEGCNKCAQGSTRFCIAHGGGRRCTFPGCDKVSKQPQIYCRRCFLLTKPIFRLAARLTSFSNLFLIKGARDKFFCAAHGGGKRCRHPGGCTKSAVGGSRYVLLFAVA
jgi:hypothetical protein